MRFLLLGVIFLGIPFFLLTKLVLPALESLEQIYSNMDVVAQKVVDQPYNGPQKIFLDD